jgi:hypothetical protein
LVIRHLPDRWGGAIVGIWFSLIEELGQAMLWLVLNAVNAVVGSIITGFG